MEAVIFPPTDEASYNLRMWRNQMEDTSIDSRIQAMKEGIIFLKNAVQ